MALPAFKDCRHYAFISYSYDDDYLWNRWVTSFHRELQMSLGRILKANNALDLYRSEKNGAVSGDLATEIKQQIQLSYAMILFVHDDYVESGWCQLELDYFYELYGEEGMRKRLYIVAMSGVAMDKLIATPRWRALNANIELVWQPFFQEDKRDEPMEVYFATPDKADSVVATPFWRRFLAMRKSFAKSIQDDIHANGGVGKVMRNAGADRQASTPPAAVFPDRSIRIFIESNIHEVDHWEAIGEELGRWWGEITQGLDFRPPFYVRPSGLRIDLIEEYGPLDDADGVVLLWGAEKSTDELKAQISSVERLLPYGGKVPPVFVAYLAPPREFVDRPVPAVCWKVLRFNCTDGGGIEVEEGDRKGLETFLQRVLSRKQNQLPATGTFGA